ncbi:MAG: hypothetical protein AB7L90_05190 [Hyphomicrobiaceae bacterium]
MALLFHIADMLCTDPVSLVVLGTLSAICAVYMKRLSAQSWLTLLYFPVLMAGALLADDTAVALGLYEPLTPGSNVISEGLPSVLIAGLLGMTVTGLTLLGAIRRFG